jgi:hypothetical protein
MNDRKLPNPKWSIAGVINSGQGHPGNGKILRDIIGIDA